MPQEHGRVLKRTVFFGVISAVLYFLLYLGADTILEYSKQGRWFFVVPVGIAFLFSVMHGNFTGHFWDLFGVKAKTVRK